MVPIDGTQVTVRLSDKVIVSLRTRDPALAKTRFSEAESALVRHWDALRRGPLPLTHVQLVALAGECYRAAVKAFEDDPDYMPDSYLRATRNFKVDVACWRNDPEDGLGDIGERDATILAALARPLGPQLLAYELGRDVSEFGIAVTYDAAVLDLFGAEADALCRERHLELDPATRTRLVREIAKAFRLLDHKLFRNADGDYSPDENAARFPPFVPPTSKSAVSPVLAPRNGPAAALGMQSLFGRWRENNGSSVAASTIRRYEPSIASFEEFTKGKDVRLLVQGDVWNWAKHRASEGRSARTVNRNDLVAIVSLLNWALGWEGGRLRADNPAKGIKLTKPKVRVKREKTFRTAEILSSAKAVKIIGREPQPSASRR